MEKANYRTEVLEEDNNIKNDLFAKIEMVGDLEVGKTSILKKIKNDEFSDKYNPTLGYDFIPYFVKVNDKILKFQIWDMCGNENYRSVLLNLYRNAAIGILVYSVTSKESFDKLEEWIEQLKTYGSPNTKIILLGNKCDDKNNRVVSFKEGQDLCKKHNLEFFMETSAKDGFKSPNFLEMAATILYKDYEVHKDDPEQSSLCIRGESIILDRNSFRKQKKERC